MWSMEGEDDREDEVDQREWQFKRTKRFSFCFILCMAIFLAKVELYLHLLALNYPLSVNRER